MKKTLSIISILILFGLFFLIRGFANNLFYDPLKVYFLNDYLYAPLPEINNWKLLISMSFRYLLNGIISLVIIWYLFLKKEFVKFTFFFLIIAFVVLVVIFAYLLQDNFESGYLLPFYIRRFIIHPLFLLLLIPAFYVQQLNDK